MVDDCQVREIVCDWFGSPVPAQPASITFRHRPVDWSRRSKLRFVDFSKSLSMRLAKDAPKEAELILFESLEMTFKTSNTLLSQGWDSDSTQGVRSVVRPFHRSRVVKNDRGCTGAELVNDHEKT